MKYLLLMLGCTQIGAQSLQILPVRSAARDSVSFQIAIVQPRANPSVALEWRVSVPGHATIAPDDIKPGKAAEQARKSVMCAPQKERKESNVYRCMLTGGLEPIPNGPVAEVRLTLASKTRSVPVSVTNIIGAAADSNPVAFPEVRKTLSLAKR